MSGEVRFIADTQTDPPAGAFIITSVIASKAKSPYDTKAQAKHTTAPIRASIRYQDIFTQTAIAQHSLSPLQL